MKHVLSFACALFISTMSLLPAARAQQEKEKPKLNPRPENPAERPQKPADDFTLKLDTMLVTVPVIVSDRNGKYIPDLKLENFELYEGGIKQQIEDFKSVEEPFNVVLLLDTSHSTRLKLEDIQRAAIAFVEQLRPQDQVMVVSFDAKIYIDSEFTNDPSQMIRAIMKTRTGAMTRLYDAVDLVLTERLNKMRGRKAIVLFSDGVDNGSRLANALSTTELIEEANALLYAIQYNTINDLQPPFMVIVDPNKKSTFHQLMPGASEEEYKKAGQYLQELADRSGARLQKAENITDLNKAFAQIAQELRQQYTLSYYPANEKRDGTYRPLKVLVNQPDVVVRSRKGYRAMSAPQK